MTLPRMAGVLLIFGAIALSVVYLRAEDARTAWRIQRIQLEMVKIRRELWSTQLAIARHKSPQRIGEEVERWALDVTAPGAPRPDRTGDALWAEAR